jgi:hypothetical protein
MSDISKNDVVGWANQIIQMQKRIEDIERLNAVYKKANETMEAAMKVALGKIKTEVDSLISTFASGRSDEKDHEVAKP